MKNENLGRFLRSVVRARIAELFKQCPHNPQVLEAALGKYYDKLEARKKQEEGDSDMDPKERRSGKWVNAFI